MAWWVAWATAWRMPDAAPMTQSSRVWLTISMMAATPRPSSPTRVAHAPSSSISLDAFDRLPSLSLSRWMGMPLRVAVGRPARHGEARETARRLGQDQEEVAHRRRAEPLVPGQAVGAARSPAPPAGWPGGVGPDIAAPLLLGHRHAGQGTGLCGGRPGRRVVDARGEQGFPPLDQPRRRPQGREHGVGHGDRAPVPGVDLAPAGRSRRPGPRGPRRRGPATAPRADPARPRWPSAGGSSGGSATSSMRWPYRSWVCSSGGFRLASKPHSITSSDPARVPRPQRRSSAHPAPSRRSASTRAASWLKVS